MSPPHQIFLLSPANCGGKRAGFLLRKDARSTLARRLRSDAGATIGEVFTFMSGLYFRGKLAYALAFAKPPDDCVGVQVIVPGRGLCPPGTGIDLAGLRAIAGIPVDPGERRYTGPLQRDAARLAERLHPTDAVVLLGSIATAKYLEPLKEVLGPRLRVPREFIGRGDMSRGALMLRCASEGRELTYIQGSEPVLGPKRSSAR
ncbi:MAG: hypothetical protein AUH06_01550 [Gemmatimonadetes bacterium 13_2_20CM_69_27]|nr:MAG: hypothetical protein AUH06_01550 [Gemmatimonadetes bacterium 13_2_20CM_69_27]OLB60433.1 MAG: hypothetical protein AUI13_00295 [Gemmatimonadetes bacterium 13_2_20CM_2_69_23]PYO30379.1 MAG: hypothetical protein DMD32_13890 [Gemmatimonadota bacterium]PYP24491.1 MAG: hypothetical protein DMD51_11690 [Gemmatimonadota bacterium]